MTEAAQAIKAFILDQFLPGEDPASLTDETRLISSRILDSVATLQLVAFLERQFGIAIEAHEVDVENLDTVSAMRRFVGEKTAPDAAE